MKITFLATVLLLASAMATAVESIVLLSRQYHDMFITYSAVSQLR